MNKTEYFWKLALRSPAPAQQPMGDLSGLTIDIFCNCNCMAGFMEECVFPTPYVLHIQCFAACERILLTESDALVGHALTHSCIPGPGASK